MRWFGWLALLMIALVLWPGSFPVPDLTYGRKEVAAYFVLVWMIWWAAWQ